MLWLKPMTPVRPKGNGALNMESETLQIDNDHEWIQFYIENEEFLDLEYQWWRDNELLVALSWSPSVRDQRNEHMSDLSE